MGFFDRLAFWKKRDDFAALQPAAGMDPYGLQPMGMPPGLQPLPPLQPVQPMPQFGAMPPPPIGGFGMEVQSLQSAQSYGASKDFEVISAKLDALRAAVESISQRLANLERIARGEQEVQDYRRRQW